MLWQPLPHPRGSAVLRTLDPLRPRTVFELAAILLRDWLVKHHVDRELQSLRIALGAGVLAPEDG